MSRPLTEMHKEKITKPDGRYLIFYSFDDRDSESGRLDLPDPSKAAPADLKPGQETQ